MKLDAAHAALLLLLGVVHYRPATASSASSAAAARGASSSSRSRLPDTDRSPVPGLGPWPSLQGGTFSSNDRHRNGKNLHRSEQQQRRRWWSWNNNGPAVPNNDSDRDEGSDKAGTESETATSADPSGGKLPFPLGPSSSPATTRTSSSAAATAAVSGASALRAMATELLEGGESPSSPTSPLRHLHLSRRDWGRVAANSVQIGLAVLLFRSMWKVVTELLDELSREVSGTSTAALGGEPLFVTTERLPHVLAACDTPLTLTPPGTDGRPVECPPHVRAVVRGLLASGLPLRDTPPGPSSTASQQSVESVLRHLTVREAGLLRQCLWIPPPTPNDDNHEYDAWADVAGLDRVREHLRHAVEALRGQHHPARHAFRALFDPTPPSTTAASSSSNVGPLASESSNPGGVLLYGPPGCGKTLLVRSLAAAARVPCLVVTPSNLLRQYVGETNRQVRNLFSLAQKLAPCILCVDELDGLFRERSDSEHEVSRDLKTEFLQWWDGMLSDPATSTSESSSESESYPYLSRRPILVVGATNRPFDVDTAVLRRLPHAHFVGLPGFAARVTFVRSLLARVPSKANVDDIAAITEGYTPSDLRQLLQLAATLGPLRDNASSDRHPVPPRTLDGAGTAAVVPRPLTTDDVRLALRHARPTPLSPSYRRALQSFARRSLGTHDGGVESLEEADDEWTSGSRRGSPDATQGLWETGEGTFYHLGQLVLDRQAFDVLSEVARHLSQEASDGASDEDGGGEEGNEDGDGDSEQD